MNRLVIGIAGSPGTGKSTLARRLESEHGFFTAEGSSILKAAALDDGGLVLRERTDYDGYYRASQRKRGMDWLSASVLIQPWARVAQIGLRSRPDVYNIRRSGGLVIGLICPIDVCLERIDRTNPKNPRTPEEYLAHMASERSLDEFGSHTEWTVATADVTIDTSKPIGETFASLDKAVATLEQS